MAAADDIRRASDQFYAALNRLLAGDPGAMPAVWSHDRDVTTMHPLGGRETGWEEVRTGWERAAKAFSGGRVAVKDLRVVAGADLAYTVGTEAGEGTVGGQRVRLEHRVTNVYRRENGTWAMVHHHTDLAPALQRAVERATTQPG